MNDPLSADPMLKRLRAGPNEFDDDIVMAKAADVIVKLRAALLLIASPPVPGVRAEDVARSALQGND